MKMNGPACLEVGDSVNVCASPMDTYKIQNIFTDGTYAIVLSVEGQMLIQS